VLAKIVLHTYTTDPQLGTVDIGGQPVRTAPGAPEGQWSILERIAVAVPGCPEQHPEVQFRLNTRDGVFRRLFRRHTAVVDLQFDHRFVDVQILGQLSAFADSTVVVVVHRIPIAHGISDEVAPIYSFWFSGRPVGHLGRLFAFSGEHDTHFSARHHPQSCNEFAGVERIADQQF